MKDRSDAHLISRTPPPMGPLYDGVPGEFSHLSCQSADFERSNPQ